MSIDRRLREGLQRSSPAIDPDSFQALERVRDRARRHVVARGIASTAIVALVIGLAAVSGPRVLDALREQPPGPVQQPTPSVPLPGEGAIAGTYTTTITDREPVVRDNQMAGEWTVTFRSDGVLEVSAPESFQESRSGYSFEVSGGQFRTDLFRTDVCNDKLPGRYRWQRSGDRLTFAVISEPCAARAELFASVPWHPSDGDI